MSQAVIAQVIHRILAGQIAATGVAAAGEILDARGVLRAPSGHISLELASTTRA